MKRYYIDTVHFCINKVYSNNAHHYVYHSRSFEKYVVNILFGYMKNNL